MGLGSSRRGGTRPGTESQFEWVGDQWSAASNRSLLEGSLNEAAAHPLRSRSRLNPEAGKQLDPRGRSRAGQASMTYD